MKYKKREKRGFTILLQTKNLARFINSDQFKFQTLKYKNNRLEDCKINANSLRLVVLIHYCER